MCELPIYALKLAQSCTQDDCMRLGNYGGVFNTNS